MSVHSQAPRVVSRSFPLGAHAVWRFAPLGLAAALLCGCGGGGDSPSAPAPGESLQTLGVSVAGLAMGQSVVLQNNGADDFIVSANGFFRTAASWPLGSSYAFTVKTQPAGQRCSVARGSGTLTMGNPSVLVDCVVLPGDRNSLGGAISGVPAGQTVVLSSGSEDLALNADGGFTFTMPLAGGAPYAVTVKAKPDGLGCVVRNGSGSIAAAVVDTVAVRCVPQGDLSDGSWEQDQCYPVEGGVGLKDVWRITHTTPSSLSVGSGGVSYRDSQCGGVGTPMSGPLVGTSWIDQLRSGSSGELTAYWGIRSYMASPAKPVVLVRKGNYLCQLEDNATASAYPDAASVGPAVTAAIAAGKCYTPR